MNIHLCTIAVMGAWRFSTSCVYIFNQCYNMCLSRCLQCSVQGWEQCQNVVDILQNASHPISTSITECSARNNPFASTSSTGYTNADNLVQTGGSGVRTGEAATAAPEPEECPLTMDERVRALLSLASHLTSVTIQAIRDGSMQSPVLWLHI